MGYVAILLVVVLWIKDKCNFFQKYTVSDATDAELEVVLETMKELDKENGR